jgi:hypothetical protein
MRLAALLEKLTGPVRPMSEHDIHPSSELASTIFVAATNGK